PHFVFFPGEYPRPIFREFPPPPPPIYSVDFVTFPITTLYIAYSLSFDARIPRNIHIPGSKFTGKKKMLFDFEGESGNTVYFCLRYESPTGGEEPFGPVLSAVIP
ncbi:MAG: hypothetical protein LBH43_09455, partial [Treponema sp.]|nr:hypothetical protein [Treponema sp.]